MCNCIWGLWCNIDMVMWCSSVYSPSLLSCVVYCFVCCCFLCLNFLLLFGSIFLSYFSEFIFFFREDMFFSQIIFLIFSFSFLLFYLLIYFVFYLLWCFREDAHSLTFTKLSMLNGSLSFLCSFTFRFRCLTLFF